ncbi:reverse transcriptase/maturase family protein [Anaerotruncus rubiinfantis]|uniref:reverse transcriptase/maturase family protein n=1 Tax=Anaerotruncus rubiinfantis TaxID=1720200 RepID=UPI0011C9BD47|nr:reverse transcriptase/maturase family protein [Anaerotruncus rubiinfantis]
MRNPIAVLKSLTEKSKDVNYKFQRLYRNLYNPEFYWLAYKNIYANKGSMTAGVDGSTMDNMSDSRIEKIICSLKSGAYKPNPARREYIAKKNSKKKRPLGIPSGDDKLVQEVVRMILESIFEPNFSKRSHGSRPKKSCHTALKQIHDTFTGAHWFVEGDIEACFNSFDHHELINLLRRRIDDETFIALMWKFMKAGYMEQWQYHKTYCGTPQGSGISPILANIYLDELDKFMEDYKADFDVGSTKRRRFTHEYHVAKHKVERYKLKGKACWDSLTDSERKLRAKTLKALQREMRSTTAAVPLNASYKTIQYVRYADDFIIGVIGSKVDAQRVKDDVKQFLADTLKLKMSDEKTKITHTGDRARFLGYDITVSRLQQAKKLANGNTQRCHSYVVQLLVPREKWVNKLLEYKAMKVVLNENGRERYKALHRGKLINKSDIEILSAYNSEIRGLYNFYSIANDSYKIGIFANIMKYSMFKTFANKYRTNVHRIKDRFFQSGNFTVEYRTKAGKKQAVYYNKGFKRKLEAMTAEVAFLPQYQKYDRFNSLKNRIKLGLCEMCGKKSNDIALHQVKRMKDLTGNSAWEILMLERRRKTLAVCPECHSKIHP